MILSTFVFLLLTASLSSLDAVHQFGCDYSDNTFGINPANVEASRYGREIVPLQLNNASQLDNIVEDFRSCFRTLMRDHIFNSVDDYLELFNDVEQANSIQNFSSFYQNYIPKYHPRMDYSGMTLELLNSIISRIAPKRTSIAQHVFMASTQEDLIISKRALRTIKDDFVRSPHGVRITNIMAVLKFNISSRIGHILMDCGYAIPETPIVLMQDGQPLSGAMDIGNVRQNVRFSVWPENRNYIVAVNGPQEGCFKTKLAYLIYVGLPFCPVKHIVQKFDLTRFDRYLVKKHWDGHPMAGLYFYNLHNLPANFSAVKRSSHPRMFTAFMVTTDVNGTRHKGEIHISYARVNGTVELLAQEKTYIDQVCQYLNISIPVLYGKLVRLQRVMTNLEFLVNINRHMLGNKMQSTEVFIQPECEPKHKKMKY